MQGANVSGANIQVNYDKATVKDAPRIDADGALSPEEEETLYRYYGLGSGSGTTTTNVGGEAQYGAAETAGVGTTTTGNYDTTSRSGHDDDFVSDRAQVGHDTSGPTTDDAMTLSEEQVNVGVQRREAGRARLRKYVVTENVTQTVPVSHEEVRLEREPITDANIGAATSGPAISEEEHEVILHEERPVVQKEAVPVERVRLDTETVTENVTINEEVRKERVDTDLDGDGNFGEQGTGRTNR